MKKEKIDIPSVAEIDDLNEASARSLLKQLVALIAMLHGLIKELRETLADARHQLADERHQREQLQRALFGPSSEKMPPMEREVKERIKKEETPEEAALRKEKTKEKREKNAQMRRDELETKVVDHPIEDPCCPNCNANVDDAARLADVVSEEYEIVTTRLIRREHHQEKRVCGCGTFLYGEAVERVADGVIHGPELHAHVVVSKCADSIPVERLAKILRRTGMPIGRSTLNDLFHRVATLLLPIYTRMIERVAESEYVSADETTVRVQQKGKCRTAWMWTFITSRLVTYVFSASRSGETPFEVLGGTQGNLQVDGFTGYNHVTCPEGRTRAGCWSHARRNFFKAMKTAADEARHVLDQILEMYLVEYEALDKNILGTEAHRLLRQAKTKPIVEALFTWLETEKDKHLPLSPMGQAISYALNQWDSLTVFLNDAKISLDNNLSERMLRLIALGRKNFLFVGHDEGGQNLAILQSLVSSCIANDVNPQDYLADVLMRIQDHPQSAIDELLPDVWKPPG